MDFTDINSVQDLLNKNNEEESITSEEMLIESLTDAIYKEDPVIAQGVIIHLLETLSTFHQNAMTDYLEKGETAKAMCWTGDNIRLITALDLIKDIQL